MRILQLLPLNYGYRFGGTQKVTRLILEGLSARGHDCHVLHAGETPHEGLNSFFEQIEAWHGGARQGVPRPPTSREGSITLYQESNGVAYCETAQRLVDELRPDVVLSMDFFCPMSVTRLVATIAPEKLVLGLHILPVIPNQRLTDSRAAMWKPLLDLLGGHPLQFIAVSRFMRQRFLETGGPDSTVIYSPVFGEGPFPKLSNPNGLITMINPTEVKGAAIFAALAESLPSRKFGVVPTWGGLDPALAALGNVSQISPSVNIDEVFAQISVLVVPSIWEEAFGLVVVEAMLRGIPVLTSNAGGLPEAKLGVPGVVPVKPIEYFAADRLDALNPHVPPQDIEPWREAVSSLLEPAAFAANAEQSRAAACAFVAANGFDKYEAFLEGTRRR